MQAARPEMMPGKGDIAPSIDANGMRGASSATGNDAWEMWHCAAYEALEGGQKSYSGEACVPQWAHRPT